MQPNGFSTNPKLHHSSYKMQRNPLVLTTPRIPLNTLTLYIVLAPMAKKACSRGPSRRGRVLSRQARMAPYETQVIDLTQSPIREIPLSSPTYDADNESSTLSSSDSAIKLSPKYVWSPSESGNVPPTPPANPDSQPISSAPASNPTTQTGDQNKPPSLVSPDNDQPKIPTPPTSQNAYQPDIHLPPDSSTDPFFELLQYPNDYDNPIFPLSNLAGHDFFGTQDPYNMFYNPYQYTSTIPPFKGAPSIAADPTFHEQKRFALSQLEKAQNRDEWYQILFAAEMIQKDFPYQQPGPSIPKPHPDPCINISSGSSVNSPLDDHQGDP